MERIKQWFLLGVLLLSGLGAPAWAQPAPGGRAQVYGVTEADFTVPQVRLPNTAVAQRINRTLLRLVVGDHADNVDSLGTARQQLRQADRASRYDANEKVLYDYGRGLVGADYNVLLNQDFLLSLGFTLEFTGAHPMQKTGHVTFDLRTGRPLRLADAVADSPGQLTPRMDGAINRRMGETLAEIVTTTDDSAQVADLTERFHWNKATRRVNFARAGRPDGAPGIALDEFALTPRALLLFYRFELPHVIQNFEPDDTYRFPYARVRPRGPLVPLAHAAGAPKKP